MPALARLGFKAVLYEIPAPGAAVLFRLHFCADHAITQLVRTLDSLTHKTLLPGCGHRLRVIQDLARGDLGGA